MPTVIKTAPATQTRWRTAADMHRDLGGIPLDRILVRPFVGTATEDDVVAALSGSEKRVFELLDGVLVEKAMGTEEAILAGVVFGRIWDYLKEHNLGRVVPGDGPFRLKPGNVRTPDVSFVPWDMVPEPGTGGKIWSVTPALAVEVLSESNTKAEIDRKLDELFSTGCKLAWVIDPRVASAKVYTSATKFKDVGPDGVLDGGKVLPGFKLPLSDLFGDPRPPKKRSR